MDDYIKESIDILGDLLLLQALAASVRASLVADTHSGGILLKPEERQKRVMRLQAIQRAMLNGAAALHDRFNYEVDCTDLRASGYGDKRMSLREAIGKSMQSLKSSLFTTNQSITDFTL